MAEVYIDSLTIENFGPFYDEHTIDFRSLEGKCGILVGGKNGAGKTHLLRARTRCVSKRLSVSAMTRWAVGRANFFAKSGSGPTHRRFGITPPLGLTPRGKSKTIK